MSDELRDVWAAVVDLRTRVEDLEKDVTPNVALLNEHDDRLDVHDQRLDKLESIAVSSNLLLQGISRQVAETNATLRVFVEVEGRRWAARQAEKPVTP